MEVVIPGYKIIKVIGKGGMASVYIAVQESFNRQVALKIMARHLTGDEVFSERFFREARIIASLNHRNIVPVFDVGREGAHHYLSMEYLPGGDLKQRLKQGIRAEEALHVIYEIATALAYAHSKSYIHRDIKPENILFREDNTVVLTDFGIAKALDTSDCNMTSTGMIVGSPHYMSPEQALAREIDARSDIYSLGVVFYEVLVGKPLYDANSSVAAAIKHISEPIPKLPETFSYLQPMLEKMVAKAPEDRFQSAMDVAIALEPYLRTAPENWKTVLQEEFVSETEGGTRIMLRATGQHSASSVATPAPMPSRSYRANATTLHGDKQTSKFTTRISDAAVKLEHKIEAGLKQLRTRLAALRYQPKTVGAVAGVLVLAIAIGAVVANRKTEPTPLQAQTQAQPVKLAAVTANDNVEPKPRPELRVEPQPIPVVEQETAKPAVSKVEAPTATAQGETQVTVTPPRSDRSGDVLANYLDNLDASADAATETAVEPVAMDVAPVAESITEVENPVALQTEAEAMPEAAEPAQAESSGVNIIASAEAAADADSLEDSSMQLALLQAQAVAQEPSGDVELPSADAAAVENLLADAKDAVRRGRLMLPKKNSAFTLYQQVLEMDPGNPTAVKGLDTIVAKYLTLSSKKLNAGELDEAQEFADRAQSVAMLDQVSAQQKEEADKMLKAIDRVRYLETMEKLETWISIVKQKQNLTPDDLNRAYESYMTVLNNNYRNPQVKVAHDIYANAFFDLGKRYFKEDDLEVSKELIAKGLEINPEHEKLQDLNARWERKKNGDEWFMDRFY